MSEAQQQKELVRKWYVVRAISGKEKKVKTIYRIRNQPPEVE